MLKPRAAIVATLAAFAVTVLGAQAAAAVELWAPPQGPSAEPSATPGSASVPAAGGDTMTGTEPDPTSDVGHEGATGGSHNMAGMSDEDMPGMSHQPAPRESHEDDSNSSDSTEAASEDESSHAHAGDQTASGPRPVAALAGGFAALNGAVLVSAAIVRRRDQRLASASPRPSRPAK